LRNDIKKQKIETIIAEIELENIASHKVLERCRFKKYKKRRRNNLVEVE
jgi:RimJ/RimL family protein N-acetyltransferase